MKKLYVVTVATENKYYFNYLKKTVELFGSELIVLGWNQKWKGFNWRFQLMKNFLNEINHDDVVCFIDGYDVVCTRNLNKLIDKFIEIQFRENCKIIIGHDKVISPLNYLAQYLLFDKCKNKYLNAGSYIGYAKDLLFILNSIHDNLSNDDERDDQILMTTYCNSNQAEFYIDINNEIFLVIGNSFNDIKQNITFKNNELIYNLRDKPFFIHAPASTYLDYIIKNTYSEYDDNNDIQKKIYNDFYNDKIYKLTNHFINEKKELLIMILLFIILLLFLINKSPKKK